MAADILKPIRTIWGKLAACLGDRRGKEGEQC